MSRAASLGRLLLVAAAASSSLLAPAPRAALAAPPPPPPEDEAARESDRARPLHDRVLAVVNDEVITFYDVDERLRLDSEYRQLAARLSGPALDERRRAFERAHLERIIEERLVLQQFRRDGLTLDANDLSEAEEELGRQAERMGGEENLRAALLEVGVLAQRFEQRIRDEIAIRRLFRAKIAGEIFASPEDARRFYREHAADYEVAGRVVVRLIYASERAHPGEARARIDEACARLASGEDPTEVARALSDDVHAAEGGLWPPFEDRVQLLQPVADVANALEPGTWSDVIATPRGFYLVRVEERVLRGVRPFAEVQEDIFVAVKRSVWERRVSRFLERLKREAYIDRFEDGAPGGLLPEPDPAPGTSAEPPG